MTPISILHIIKTNVFLSDGRLLKWINSLKSHQIKSKVLLLEDDNKVKEFIYNEAQVTSIRLFFRKFFSQRKGYLVKVPEYTLKTFPHLNKNSKEIVVFHDMQHYMTLLLLCAKNPKQKKIVWDLHELPHEILCKNLITKRLLQYILQRIDLLVYTNEERRQYMKTHISYSEKEYVILNNFPDKKFIKSEHNPLNREITQWLDGKPYVLWLGWASEGRNFPTVLKALEKYQEEIKIIILGPVEPGMKEIVNKAINSKFIFQTFVPQNEMINYIDNAFFSIILYKNISANNFLCEPNRLYQLLSRNIPVICGSNPPMKNLVNKLDAGIVLEDDGSDVNLMKLAVKNMFQNRKDYYDHLHKINKEEIFSWEEQFIRLKSALVNLQNDLQVGSKNEE